MHGGHELPDRAGLGSGDDEPANFMERSLTIGAGTLIPNLGYDAKISPPVHPGSTMPLPIASIRRRGENQSDLVTPLPVPAGKWRRRGSTKLTTAG